MSRLHRSTGTVQRWLLVAPLLCGAACGGPQKLGGAGATCFRDDDCEPGLICVAPAEDDINRVCSNDPTPLISNVEGPPPVEMPMGGEQGMGGAMMVAGGGMGAIAGVAGSSAGSATGGSGGSGASGGGGSDGGGSAGSAGTDTGGSAGTAGSGGTEPEGGGPN